MFYWMKRNAENSETLDSLGNMSKTQILRGIVTEKLTTAAQEILAVVERTVAGYEEEAAGFREEIDRQRRQLEVLLQPRVKLERTAQVPELDDHDVVIVTEEDDEEEQEPKQKPGSQSQNGGECSSNTMTKHRSDLADNCGSNMASYVVQEDTESLGLMWYDYEEEGEDEEQQLISGMSSRQRQEDLKDPDYQIPSGVRSDRRKPGRPRISEPPNHVDLRIRILEDSQTDVLSTRVFQKYPLQELQCPLGLQEPDFLDLLRSSFPQLATGKPFDVFTCDRNKRLQPLTVKTLTPEEIDNSIRSIGAGNSALYIRLKVGQAPQSISSESLHHPQVEEDVVATDSPSSSMAADQTNTYASLLSPKDTSERRRRGRPRLGEEPSHHIVRVCMLEDSQSQFVSKEAMMKSPVLELQCPRGLQEAGFLDLLRSNFPQLAGDDKPFNMFKSDRSRRLQRLRVKTLTPEKIYRAMKCTGVGKTVLYIRLKTGDEEEEEGEEDEEDEFHLLQRSNESPKNDEPGLRSSRQDLKIEDGEDEVVESNADASDDDKGGDEDDWKPNPEQQSPKTKKQRLNKPGVEGKQAEKSKTPCKVCGVWYRLLGSLIKHAWKHMDEPQCVCGVCGKPFQSADELKQHLQSYQKTHACSYCGKSFFTLTGLNCHTTVHTGNRPFKCEVCQKTFVHMSSLNIHHWVHVEDKPHKCDVCLKAFGLKAQLKAHMKVHMGRDKFHCHICGKSVYDLRSLTRHKATHSGERRYGCEVCGKRFKLPDTLKSHAKTHMVRDRPYLCHICCKTFLSNCGLTAHMKTHSDERPFVCIVCSKGFLSNGELKVHMRVHTGEAPYGCSECNRFFKRKTHLNNHIRTHLGIKLFVCGVCGKACSRREHLTVHMRTHNGDRPYKCSLCDKAFTQGHCLKTHMKSHQGEEKLFLSEPTT